MKKPSNTNSKICIAALQCAEKMGWENTKFDNIAKAAKIPLAEIKLSFANTTAIVPAIADWVSAETFSQCGKPDMSASVRERLFEVLMARFDVLQTYRKAFLSIASASRRDPKIALILVPAQIEAMKEVLKFSVVPTSKFCAPVTPVALWGIFALIFHVWQSDETIDMSKTMAATDRYLRTVDRVVTLLRLKPA
jgi:ubiquinone biosynthesis protein COQ9